MSFLWLIRHVFPDQNVSLAKCEEKYPRLSERVVALKSGYGDIFQVESMRGNALALLLEGTPSLHFRSRSA